MRHAQRDLERWTTEVASKRLFEAIIVVLEETGKLEDLSLAGTYGPEPARSETLVELGMDLGGILSALVGDMRRGRTRGISSMGVYTSSFDMIYEMTPEW